MKDLAISLIPMLLLLWIYPRGIGDGKDDGDDNQDSSCADSDDNDDSDDGDNAT